MIGRQAELSVLRRQVEKLLHGSGGIVSLVGEAGIGKSRLVAEALAAPEAGRVRTLVARSLSVGRNLGYHPFNDLLRGWAAIAGGADDAEALAHLRTGLRELCGDGADEMLPFFASMMGMTLDQECVARLSGIEGEALERMTIKAMRSLFEHLSKNQPLLVFFEDLHWADLSSLRLLEALLRLVTGHPILFVHAFRPEHRDTGQHMLDLARAQYPLQHRLIELTRLEQKQCAEIAGHILGGGDESCRSAIAAVAARAEGCPFFVEEALRSLVDDGTIELSASGARCRRSVEAVALPSGVREVIAGRLQRLEPEVRAVLEVGAVIGRGFLGRIVAAVLAEEADLPARLAILVERGIVGERRTRRTAAHSRRSFASEVEYVFTHALLQETAYETIEPQRRRQLHEQVATAVEAVFATRLGDFHGMLAYHYLRAENLPKAEEYLFLAGEEAARSAASSEALAFFREASRIYMQMHGDGGDSGKKALLERNIGLALMNTGRLSEAMAHFEQSLAFLGDPPRSLLAAGLRCGFELAAIFARLYLPAGLTGGRRDERYREHILALYPRVKAQSTSDPTRLLFDYTRAIHLLNRTDPAAVPEQVIGLYSGFAAMFAYSGISFRLGRRYLELADGLRRPGHAKDRFDHDCLVCICNYLEGVWDEERGTVPNELIDQALRYGGLWEVNTYLGLDADRRLRRGDFAGARRRLEQIADIADTYGFEFARTNHAAETMLLLLEERRLEEARDAADFYYSGIDDPPLRVLALGSRLKAEALLGDLGAARRSLAAAEQVVAAAPVIPPWHMSGLVVGRLHLDLAELEAASGAAESTAVGRARRDLRLALRIAGRCAAQRGEVYRLAALVYRAVGDESRAVSWWQRATIECERLGALPELARTHADIAAAGADIGDGRDAAAHRARAAELFAALGLDGAETAARRAA